MFFKDFVSVKRQKIKRGASQTYDTPSSLLTIRILKTYLNRLRNITKYLLKIVSCIKLFNTRDFLILNIFSYFCNVFCISYEETQSNNIENERIFS